MRTTSATTRSTRWTPRVGVWWSTTRSTRATTRRPTIGTAYHDHVLTLAPGLKPTLPVGAAFKQALHALADQMLANQFPAHPDFDPDRNGTVVRPADLKIVLDVVRQAIDAPDGRVEVERKDRLTVRRIANPLLLGEM